MFVATLGASNYTYAKATWTQALPDWIASHIRAFEYFGAVPALLVPDNLKSAVARACRYEPEPNATYLELASHYGTAILPARVRRPRDKAKASYCTLCGGWNSDERRCLASIAPAGPFGDDHLAHGLI